MQTIIHVSSLPPERRSCWNMVQSDFCISRKEGHGVSLGPPCVAALVGQQHGSAANAEEAVGNQHAALVAKVPANAAGVMMKLIMEPMKLMMKLMIG